jgi:hypothetical protein
MPVFPSEEWMEAFCDEVAAHPGALHTARALDGVYRFVVQADGPLRATHSYDLLITADGDAAHVQRLDEPGDRPRLMMTARYGRWRQLINGELDVGLAILLRRLRISGDLMSLRNQLDDVKPLTESLRRVETVWLGS